MRRLVVLACLVMSASACSDGDPPATREFAVNIQRGTVSGDVARVEVTLTAATLAAPITRTVTGAPVVLPITVSLAVPGDFAGEFRVEVRVSNAAGMLLGQLGGAGTVVAGTARIDFPAILQAPPPLVPRLELVPGAVTDVGLVQPGMSSSGTVEIRNVGGADTGPLTVTTAGPAWTLGVDGCSGVSLAPQQQCRVEPRFSPTQPGLDMGSVTFSSATAAPVGVTLMGSGAGPGMLSLTPASHDFGSLPVGATTVRVHFVLRNSGGSSLRLTSIAASTGYNWYQDFSGVTACSSFMTLGAGSSCDLAVSATPDALGARPGTLTITSDVGASVVANLTVTGTAAPNLVAGARLDFASGGAGAGGGHGVGHLTPPLTAYLYNNGTIDSGPITFTLSGPDAASFSIVNNTCPGNLAGGARCTLQVRGTPLRGGQHTATLTASAGTTVTWPINLVADATSVLRFEAPSIDINALRVGDDSATVAVYIRNDGPAVSAPISNQVTFDTTRFRLLGNDCAGQVLMRRASCAIRLRYHSLALGSYSSTVTVPGVQTQASISSSGLVASTLTVRTPAIDFPAITPGSTSAPMDVVLENTGASAITSIASILSGPGGWLLDGSACAGGLAPGARCTVTVRFAPTGSGYRLSMLVFTPTPAASAPATLSVGGNTGPATVNVTRTTEMRGHVRSFPPGIDCPPTCSAGFTGPNLLLRASDDSSDFAGWSGACSGAGADCFLQLSAPSFDVGAAL